MKTYCCGFAFDPSFTDVLLIRKAKPEWQKGMLNGVGGTVEPGEAPIDAMQREFIEETGIYQGASKWIRLAMLGDEHVIVHFFFTIITPDVMQSAVRGMARAKEPLELHGTLMLPKTVIPNLRWLIPLALDTRPEYGIGLPVIAGFRSPVEERA